MRTKTLKELAAAIMIAAIPSLSQPAQGAGWPVGLGGSAYDISLSRQGKPILRPIETHLPVLYYAGTSKDHRLMAYTTLDELDENAPMGHRSVTAKELYDNPASHPVPSGHLVIEDRVTRSVHQVDEDGQYVVAAAWSPADPNLLAYTFSTGSDFGVAVMDIAAGRSRVLKATGVLADYLAWSASGSEVHVFAEISQDVMFDPEGHAIHRLTGEQLPIRAADAKTGIVQWSSALPVLSPLKKLEGGEQPFYLALPNGTTVRGQDLLGFSELSLVDSSGHILQSIQAHALIAVLPSGIVFKRFTQGGPELGFLSVTGDVITLLSSKATVTFKLPFHNGSSPDMTVTQAGSALTTKCNVSSHTGNLSYAYDMQAKAGNEDILVAGDGTVAYFYKTATCNSLDNGSDHSPCADYVPSCSSNGGWGNVVILQHSDGSWTKYAHLRKGTVVPATLTRSAPIGCRLASEGHTGNTAGAKNGCGDHLHFQRQTSSSRDGASTSISFSDATNPLSCKSYESGNAGRSCTF